MLRDQHTRLTFNGYTSELLPINNGIGQGKPSSMILYLIYSYALVNIPQMESSNRGAYMDDTIWVACNTFQECDTRINAMLDKQDT